MKANEANILMESKYFEIWDRHVSIRETTKNEYKTALRKMGHFMALKGLTAPLELDSDYYDKERGTHLPIDESFAAAFIEYLKSTGASSNTLFNSIVAARNFFSLLVALEVTKCDPFEHFNNPYYEVKILDRALSLVETQKVLQAALDRDPFFRQQYVLFLLMLTCGLRSRELRCLRLSQISFRNRTILIDKGQKTRVRTVYMTKVLTEELERYVNHELWLGWSRGADREIFFYNDNPLTANGLQLLIQEVCLDAGIKRRVTSHCFRHTMAQVLQSAGTNKATIQRLMGHAHLSTTIRYLGVSKDLCGVVQNHADRIFRNV